MYALRLKTVALVLLFALVPLAAPYAYDYQQQFEQQQQQFYRQQEQFQQQQDRYQRQFERQQDQYDNY